MNYSSPITVFCLLIAILGIPISAWENPVSPEIPLEDKVRKINDLMTTYHQQGLFQGSVLVAKNGKAIYRKGFGLANMEWNIPNTSETKFRIASLGKAFTAVLILQLAEEGRLDLNSPISKYLPSYRKDNAERVTIHHLLNHTSGVPGVPPEWENHQYRHPYTMDQLVELANQATLEFEPGTRFRYSNNGYNLLGAIVENIVGKPFKAVLQERILDKLGMHDTGLVLGGDTILKRMASGHNRLNRNEYVNAPYMDESFAVGAGGMYSTVDDMLKWDQALYRNDLLSDSSKKLMFTPGLRNAGYGWSIELYVKADRSKHPLILGLGGTSEFASVLFRLPDDVFLSYYSAIFVKSRRVK